MSCMFSCCCCPPTPPGVISPKGKEKAAVFCAGSEQGGCHCLSRECPLPWPLKGAPGGPEAVALPHTRSQPWPPGGLDCFEHKPLGEVTPAVTAGGKDGVSTQGQCHRCSLWTFALCSPGKAVGRTGQGPWWSCWSHWSQARKALPWDCSPCPGITGEMSPFQIRALGHSLWLSWLNPSMHLPSVTESPLLVHHRTDLSTFSIASGCGH